MIVECPNCGARYRLSEAVLARGARLKCAACQHRWVPTAAQQLPEPPPAQPPELPPAPPPSPKVLTEADEEAAFAAVQEQLLSRWAEPVPGSAPPAPEPVTITADPGPEAEPDTESSGLARSIVAVVAGLALAVIAAGLWLGRTDLAAVPGVGPLLKGIDARSPLTLEVKGIVTQLPSSRRVLEVNGVIRNPGDTPATVAPLDATLSGPDGVTLRWSIPAPVAVLPPRQQVAFSSTVTGFPATAQTLSISLGR